jgi:hypothetical protein
MTNVHRDGRHSVQRNEQRMNAVENRSTACWKSPATHRASCRLRPASNCPASSEESGAERPAIREQAVNVMLCALACWEHDLGKSKLDLAEASRIWPVYIDKSTPTTRTLDKYLNIESCPKNPRNHRVIDTAEFVLRQPVRKTSAERRTLQQALTDFRHLISGIRSGH